MPMKTGSLLHPSQQEHWLGTQQQGIFHLPLLLGVSHISHSAICV